MVVYKAPASCSQWQKIWQEMKSAQQKIKMLTTVVKYMYYFWNPRNLNLCLYFKTMVLHSFSSTAIYKYILFSCCIISDSAVIYSEIHKIGTGVFCLDLILSLIRKVATCIISSWSFPCRLNFRYVLFRV